MFFMLTIHYIFKMHLVSHLIDDVHVVDSIHSSNDLTNDTIL